MSTKGWVIFWSLITILLVVYIRWSVQIEAPFNTEMYQTIKFATMMTFSAIMLGIVVATFIPRRK